MQYPTTGQSRVTELSRATGQSKAMELSKAMGQSRALGQSRARVEEGHGESRATVLSKLSRVGSECTDGCWGRRLP